MMVVVFFIILMIFTAYTMRILFGGDISVKNQMKEGKSIAVVEVEGVLLDSKDIIEKLHMAEKNEEAKAIIVRINSPGGAVGPTQEIYEEILRIDKIKPIYASFSAIAASGGYYIAAAARKIFSNPGTLTGSIGVLMQFMDLSKLYRWMKISPEVIKSGRYKDAGNPQRPLSREEKMMMEKLLKGVHKQFVRHILKLRKNRMKKDINKLAQGQIFSGEEAHRYGLVDELAGLWEAGRKIHKELKIKEKFGLYFVKKKKDFSIWDVLNDLNKVISRPEINATPVPMFL